ncbi:MAG: molybdopterin-guanine dinucleotide biosynthesis protein MobB [Gemmatimonadetes bacterium]|nr:MAG: hypothetical protein DMD67_11840 [Gemmatimonadota bacterium]TLY51186.1 MAG: molybdopterin-guanine dinucleotide biosynthesis protein MobB [Gemmatimonadota bacterium]
MAATRMISIIGRKNAGKTTLLVALSAELVRRKFRVMTIKHGTRPAGPLGEDGEGIRSGDPRATLSPRRRHRAGRRIQGGAPPQDRGVPASRGPRADLRLEGPRPGRLGGDHHR